MEFTPEMCDILKSYVYIYLDPTKDDEPFYVGKGTEDRAFTHLDEQSETGKVKRINAIRSAGMEPIIDILAYGMSDAEACLVEACVIDLLGLRMLTNQIRGQHSSCYGRVSCEDLIAWLSAKPVDITERAILITLNRSYRKSMNAQEKYEATRGTWKTGPRREQADLALAVFQGVVQEVYRIRRWVPALTLPYETRDSSKMGGQGRWEFEGEVAVDVRDNYLGRSVRRYLTEGSRNPIRYVNV